MSVRTIFHYKPHQTAFKSLPSLKSAGIKPSPWIYIVHILIIKPDTCTYGQTFISGISSTFCVWLSGYGDIGFERFVITLGVMGILFTFPPIFVMISVWLKRKAVYYLLAKLVLQLGLWSTQRAIWKENVSKWEMKKKGGNLSMVQLLLSNHLPQI